MVTAWDFFYGEGLATGLEKLYQKKFGIADSLLFLRDETKCPNLERIQCLYSDLTLEQFTKLLDKYSHVTEVSFNHNDQIRYDMVVPSIKNLHTLKKLEIAEENRYSELYDDTERLQYDRTWNTELGNIANAHPELIYLDISSRGLSYQTIDAFIEKCPGLKFLKLTGENDLKNFKKRKEVTGMEEIVLEKLSIDTTGIKNLTSATKWSLKRLSLIQCLELDENAYEYIGWQSPLLEYFAIADPKHEEDRKTGFGFLQDVTPINNKSLMYLSSCRNLQVLKLNYSKSSDVSDEGITAIAHGCSELKTIDLEGCFEVTDLGIMELSRHCHKLSDVNLTLCMHVTGFGFSCLVMNCLWLQRLQTHTCYFMSNLKLCDDQKFPEHPFSAFASIAENEHGIDASCRCMALLQFSPDQENQLICKKVYEAYDKIKEMFGIVDHRPERDSRQNTDHCSSNHSKAQAIETVGAMMDTDTPQPPKIPAYRYSSEHSWIRNLTLSNCHRVTDADVIEVSKFCPDIKILDLSFCMKLTDESVVAIAKNLTVLHTLSLEGILHLTDRSLVALNKRNFSVLTINTSPNMSLQGIQDTVRYCRKLRTLTLLNDETTAVVFNKVTIQEIISSDEDGPVVEECGYRVIITRS